MKKLILLFSVFALILTSCSSDDDDKVSYQDPFIGKWQLSQAFVEGVAVHFENCEEKTTLQVNGDGTWDETYFEKDQNDTCQWSALRQGTWENLGDNNYSRLINNFPDSLRIEEFIFEGNTLSFESDYTGLVRKAVYIKLE